MKTFVSFFLTISIAFAMKAQMTATPEDVSGGKQVPVQPASAKKASLRLSFGYGFPSGSQMVGQSYSTLSTPTSNSYNSKGSYGTYGSGIYLNASYTIMFSKIVGVDLGLHYLIGNEYKNEYAATSSNNGTSSTFQNVSFASSHGLFLSPSVVFQTRDGKFRPYLKTGFVLGTVKVKMNESVSSSGGGSTQTETRVIQYTGGMPLGFKGAVGAEFGILKKVNFFAEFSFISMSYFPHKGEMTEYKVNGLDQLNTIPVYQKVTMFDKVISGSSAPDPTQPSHDLRQSLPMGSISINAGIRIALGK